MALVRGEAGSRRWLVYAHSPLEDRRDVRITLPEYDEITVDVPQAGAFYLVQEGHEKVIPVAAMAGR
jgi:proline racemase